MNKKIELLAPAGSFETLYAAVNNGADAVYMGLPAFNARENADNFTPEQFLHALDYIHDRDVLAYLTVNTLIYDRELNDFTEMIHFAANAGVDAFIVQDIGMAHLIRGHFPTIKLHASTQMTVSDLAGVRQAAKMGFDRVVLARELTLDEIIAIQNESPVELEVFVHGALCICYSGQCLMSSIIGARSGNRGNCAQPCRLPYAFYKDNEKLKSGHLLSPKDVCGLDELPRLIDAGISSVKIEGRMKGPEYVAATASVYRKYIDCCQMSKQYRVSSDDINMLMQVFNRGGKSSGWLNDSAYSAMITPQKPKNWGRRVGKVVSRDGKNMIRLTLEDTLAIGDGIEVWTGSEPSPGGIVSIIRNGHSLLQEGKSNQVVSVGDIHGDVKRGDLVYKTSSKQLNKELQLLTHHAKRVSKVSGKMVVRSGQKARLKVWDDEGIFSESESDSNVESSQKMPLSKERILEQLSKTGEYPLAFLNIEIEKDENVFLPIRDLNALRRNVLEDYIAKKRSSFKRNIPYPEIQLEETGTVQRQSRFSVLLYKGIQSMIQTLADHDMLSSVDRIYLPLYFFKTGGTKNIQSLLKDVPEVFVWIPAAVKEMHRAKTDELVSDAVQRGVTGIMLNSLGDVRYVQAYPGLSFVAGQGFNTVNRFTVKALNRFSIKEVTLSHEVALNDIDMFGDIHSQLEIAIYGRQQMMKSEYCVVGASVNCHKRLNKGADICSHMNGNYYLKDRMGKDLPVLPGLNGCGCSILNAVKSDLIYDAGRIRESGISLRADFFDEEPAEMIQIIQSIIKV